MAKNAVYDAINNFNITADLKVKQAALLFDKVFVKKPISAPSALDFSKYGSPKAFSDMIRQNDACFEYLIEQKVLAPFETPDNVDIKSLTPIERQLLGRAIVWITKNSDVLMKTVQSKDQREQEQGLLSARGIMNKGIDAVTRFYAIRLAKDHAQEFYPILRSTESFDQEGTKTEVVRLLLNYIPQPTADTPWEAIIDFRRDESTRLKYLALMNWINELSSSSLTINELNEKMEYLYLDYKRSFERHRLKATTGVLEIITGAAIGFFTSNVPAALNLASNIVKVGSTVLSLHQEEEKLPGKEIAYIYHANKTFRDGRSLPSA
jgi:hypothetical protein